MKNLEKMTIAQIEKEIKETIYGSALARREATMMLYKLKISGRYRENPLYDKSSFKVYLEDVYGIRIGTFNDAVRAYRKFPEESCAFSVGLVSSIYRKCGVFKEKKVMDEIVAKKDSLKTPIKRAQINKIIAKHAKPVPKKAPGYKAMYESELRAHQKTKEAYRYTLEELKAAKNQIAGLKKTVLSLKALVEAVRDYERRTETV